MLGIDPGHGRVKRLVERQRRIDQRLGGKSRAMRVLLEPERVALSDLRQRQSPPAEAALQILVKYIWLDRIFQKLLGYGYIFRAFRDQRTKDPHWARQFLAVVAEGHAAGHDVIV